MGTEFFIRQMLNLGLWIWVGLLFIPAARKKGRSPAGWFALGLLSFYLPFFAFLLGPPMLASHLTGQTSVGESDVLASVVLMSTLTGVTAGFYVMTRVRRKLQGLPAA